MASNVLKCRAPGCQKEFQSIEDLLKHVQTFESRANSLAIRLQNALQHCDTELSDDSDYRSQADSSNGSETEYDRASRKRRMIQCCPELDCRARKLQKRFRRMYHLVRHYSLHYDYNDNCPVCETPIKGGKDFLYQHKCPRDLSRDEHKRLKQARKSFRNKIKQTLQEKSRRPQRSQIEIVDPGHLGRPDDMPAMTQFPEAQGEALPGISGFNTQGRDNLEVLSNVYENLPRSPPLLFDNMTNSTRQTQAAVHPTMWELGLGEQFFSGVHQGWGEST